MRYRLEPLLCDTHCRMSQDFDIFRNGRDNEPIWLESVKTLDEAMERVESLRAKTPAVYTILSQKTRKKITITAQGAIKRE